jgi:hypothetical protein
MYIGREAALGTNHHSTLDTINNLGGIFRLKGDLDKAEQLQRQAVAGFEETVGMDSVNSDFLRALHDLGVFFRLKVDLMTLRACLRGR